MKSLKMLRVTAATVLAVGFSAGVASAATGTISGPTGPNSNNEVTFNGWDTRTVDNDNRVDVRTHNPQRADSGDTRVHHNTSSGSATSGDATNDSLVRANLSISNTSAGAAAMNNAGQGGQTGSISGATGPSSNNQVTFNGGTTVSVDNNNHVSVENWNDQDAESGDAEVNNNTTGGSATSGEATNISTTEVMLTLNN